MGVLGSNGFRVPTLILICNPGTEMLKQNTARGGLIDESAAYDALIKKRLAGIAIDAYEKEPVVDSPLVKLDNVISTPHTGAHTNEAISSMGIMAVENLISVLQGKECRYTI